jgi:hypothetical protein
MLDELGRIQRDLVKPRQSLSHDSKSRIRESKSGTPHYEEDLLSTPTAPFFGCVLDILLLNSLWKTEIREQFRVSEMIEK